MKSEDEDWKLKAQEHWLSDYMDQISRLAFGENQGVVYGQGKYHKEKLSSDYSEMYEREAGIGFRDNVAKDLLMVALQPVNIAIGGALVAGLGLIKAAFNILPALAGSRDSKLGESLVQTFVGIGVMLLAIVTPFARLYNMATRLNAKEQPLVGPETATKLVEDALHGDTKGLNALESQVQSLARSTSVTALKDNLAATKRASNAVDDKAKIEVPTFRK